MRKRLSGILPALVIALALIPLLGGSAHAETPEKPTHVYVGVYEAGVSGPSWRDLAASENVGKMFYTADRSGYAVYDGDGKLTLSNYRMTGNQYYYDERENTASGIDSNGDLTIEVVGTCSIEPTCDRATKVYGLCTLWLTIQNADNGAAVLTVHTKKSDGAAPATDAYGIGCYKTLTVLNNGGGSITVNATGDDVYASGENGYSHSYGIYAVGAYYLSGTVTGRGGTATAEKPSNNFSAGIAGNEFLSAVGQARVTGTGGSAYMSIGVSPGDILTLSGSAALTGVGGDTPAVADGSMGFDCRDVDCSGSAKLTGLGGDASSGFSTGIRVRGDSFTINSGTVAMTGGFVSERGESIGFYMWKGALTMNGGTLTCTGGDSACPPGTYSSVGMRSGAAIAVSGGELKIAAGFGSHCVGLYMRKIDTNVPSISVTGRGAATIQGNNRAIDADSSCVNTAGISASGYIRAGSATNGDDAVTIGNSCTVNDFRFMGYAVLDSAVPAIRLRWNDGTPLTYISGRMLFYSIQLARGGMKCLVAAWYDADGRLLGTAVNMIEGLPAKVVGGNLIVDEGAATYRLFYVDGTDFRPFCEAWSSDGE